MVAITTFNFSWTNQGNWLFYGGSTYSLLNNGCYFLAGSAMWMWREKIKLSLPVVIGCLALMYLTQLDTAKAFLLHAVWPYIIIYLAIGISPLKLQFLKKHDISYGFYLWAWPIQKICIFILGIQTPWLLTLTATIICLPIALLSWNFIEKPFLKWKLIKN